MIIFHHKKPTPKPRYGTLLYLGLVVIFAFILQFYNTVVGLIGIGSLMVLAGIIVEMNVDRVWQESQKWYKKNRKNVPWWNRPTPLFYAINTYVLWPLIIVMGIFDLVLAYKMIGIIN